MKNLLRIIMLLSFMGIFLPNFSHSGCVTESSIATNDSSDDVSNLNNPCDKTATRNDFDDGNPVQNSKVNMSESLYGNIYKIIDMIGKYLNYITALIAAVFTILGFIIANFVNKNIDNIRSDVQYEKENTQKEIKYINEKIEKDFKEFADNFNDKAIKHISMELAEPVRVNAEKMLKNMSENMQIKFDNKINSRIDEQSEQIKQDSGRKLEDQLNIIGNNLEIRFGNMMEEWDIWLIYHAECRREYWQSLIRDNYNQINVIDIGLKFDVNLANLLSSNLLDIADAIGYFNNIGPPRSFGKYLDALILKKSTFQNADVKQLAESLRSKICEMYLDDPS